VVTIERRPPSGQTEAKKPSKSKEDITTPKKRGSKSLSNTCHLL
jgi:hypothetical protein